MLKIVNKNIKIFMLLIFYMGNYSTRKFSSNSEFQTNEEIIINDDNDILFNSYRDVLNIKYINKYRMNYNDFITRKISLLQTMVNLFTNEILYEVICDEIKYIQNIKYWDNFVLDSEYDNMIETNFKNFDLFLLKIYKDKYIKFKDNIINLIDSILEEIENGCNNIT